MKTLFLLFLTSIMLLFFPNINYAQTPNLGTASGFVLFTAVGGFDNTGTATNVTGDVGTNVGAFNAFPPGTLIGQKHVADAIAAQAALDVEAAYTQLSGIGCGSVIGITLGGGQLLTPGVYCTGAASTLNGNLTLDAQGNPNALFIIKIDGAFATSTLSNVNLINSAQVCNVYWQINGRFDLGDGSVFRGTIVANGAIGLLGTSSLIGRGLSRAGAISLQHNAVTICNIAVLPITLISFNAKCDSKSSINLSWQTASEFNSAYFHIERSTDGINFIAIGERVAMGNSTQLLSYFFTDQNPGQGINYYRLNQFDGNGMHKYSSVKAERCSNTILEVSIYPNPFTTSVNISINNPTQINNNELKIYNAWGTEVINTIIYRQVTTLKTSDLPSGIYFYKITGNNKTIQSGRLVSLQ